MATADLTAQKLRELLDYDPESGRFTWRRRDSQDGFASYRSQRVWNARFAGKRAGHENRVVGYVSIAVFGRHYWAHRLAWMHTHSAWPSEEIDHINGDGLDNRIANLRLASRKMNQQNTRGPRGGKTLPLGAYFVPRKRERRYASSIKVDGKVKHLGYFDSPEEAHLAHLEAKRQLHPGCTI